MKINLILLIGLGFFLACNSQPSETTSLSDEKLSRIMADLNIAEAATNGLAGYTKDSLMKVYFGQVFEIHNTTADVYEKDLRTVSADLPRLQQVVLESTKLLEGGEVKKDSLLH